jgi:hypothetical protein
MLYILIRIFVLLLRKGESPCLKKKRYNIVNNKELDIVQNGNLNDKVYYMYIYIYTMLSYVKSAMIRVIFQSLLL